MCFKLTILNAKLMHLDFLIVMFAYFAPSGEADPNSVERFANSGHSFHTYSYAIVQIKDCPIPLSNARYDPISHKIVNYCN